MKPKVLVFSGYGLNCEEETKYAFELAQAQVDIVHINDVIKGEVRLKNYQILAFPGGFAYGDDTGSGRAYAQKLKNYLWEDIKKFIVRTNLMIGICNGFQILIHLGLLPALGSQYGHRQVALLPNDSARYTVRWVDVTNECDSPWLCDIKQLSLPIAHGEGKLYLSHKTHDELKKNRMVALRYIKGNICTEQNLPANPTGTHDNIAGLVDPTGRILGLMPHPERAIFFTQLPNWTNINEYNKRHHRKNPRHGPGLQIFKNAVSYFKFL